MEFIFLRPLTSFYSLYKSEELKKRWNLFLGQAILSNMPLFIIYYILSLVQ